MTLMNEAALRGTAAHPEWIPPTSRRAAEAAVDQLVSEIGIIQAQLAEPRDVWCQRTGLPAEEHASWRRRALFAKAFKERQLRQCKRLRQELRPERPVGAPDTAALHGVAQAVVDAWEGRRSIDGWSRLEFAMASLKRQLAAPPPSG